MPAATSEVCGDWRYLHSGWWQDQAQLPAPPDLIFNNFILLLHPKQSSPGNYSLGGRSSSGESQWSSVGLPGLAAGQDLPQPWPCHGMSSADELGPRVTQKE